MKEVRTKAVTMVFVRMCINKQIHKRATFDVLFKLIQQISFYIKIDLFTIVHKIVFYLAINNNRLTVTQLY